MFTFTFQNVNINSLTINVIYVNISGFLSGLVNDPLKQIYQASPGTATFNFLLFYCLFLPFCPKVNVNKNWYSINLDGAGRGSHLT